MDFLVKVRAKIHTIFLLISSKLNLFSTVMSYNNTSINSHIEDYLDYYCKLKHSPQEILEEAKLYIDDLIANGNLNLNPGSDTTLNKISSMYGYRGLGFQEQQLKEFQEFISYFETARQSAIEKRYPVLGRELLEIMQNEPCQFYRMICLNSMSNRIDDYHQAYYDIPIFNYIKPNNFIDNLLSMNFDNQRNCFYA